MHAAALAPEMWLGSVYALLRTVAVSIEGLIVQIEEAPYALPGAHGRTVALVYKRVKPKVTWEIFQLAEGDHLLSGQPHHGRTKVLRRNVGRCGEGKCHSPSEQK